MPFCVYMPTTGVARNPSRVGDITGVFGGRFRGGVLLGKAIERYRHRSELDDRLAHTRDQRASPKKERSNGRAPMSPARYPETSGCPAKASRSRRRVVSQQHERPHEGGDRSRLAITLRFRLRPSDSESALPARSRTGEG